MKVKVINHFNEHFHQINKVFRELSDFQEV